MVNNSWLYHYYSVQSKIQFGLAFEGPTRVPPTNPYYHTSPHMYATPTHHMSYGYQSPIGLGPQNSPGLISHHHNGSSLNHHGLGGTDHYRPYPYRLESQPVDYSHAQTLPVTPSPLLTPAINEVHPRQRNGTSPPPAKRGRGSITTTPTIRGAPIEQGPTYITENITRSPENVLVELQTPQSIGSDTSVGSGVMGQTVLAVPSAVPTRSRILSKAAPMEPTEFMDQWNPSPPWSDTTQKVPDISHQELSPYMTTTPPTPTSAHGAHSLPSFSFDWMPEQFVPIVDCVPCVTQDGISVPVAIPLQVPPHWHPEHSRILALQPPADRRSDEESNGG